MSLISFPARLAALAAADPERPAVTCGAHRLTRAELEVAAERLAHDLAERGIRFGDFVTVALPNSVDWFVTYVAIWKLGAIPQPVSARLPARELAEIVALAGSKVVVGVDPDGPTAALLPAGTVCLPVDHESVDHESVDHSSADDSSADHSSADHGVGDHRSPDRVPVERGPLPDAVSPAWKAPTSGGSTGRPKLIVSGDPALIDTDLEPPLMLSRDGCLVVPGPLYHNGPAVWSCQALLAGSHVVVLPRFDAEATLAAIAEHAADVVYLVPTMMKRIWRLPDETRLGYDLSSLRVVWHLAEPCPPWLKEAFIGWLGAERIWELYAGTEAQAATIIRGDEWLEHRGSVGRPSSGEISIRDTDGHELPAGEQGEVWMRATRDTPTYEYLGAEPKALEGGWESLGDVGWMDADGYLYLGDRLQDMILTGGTNVYPAEVEAILAEHPAVHSCAVIGLPDDDRGNIVHAIIEADPGEVSVDELLTFAAERLVRYKLPRSVEYVDEPLRDDAGKVRRSALRAARLADESG